MRVHLLRQRLALQGYQEAVNFGFTDLESEQRLAAATEKDLITLLMRCHLDWNQLEQFADFLVKSSKENPFDFSEKAIAIYNYIQLESKTFSFEIFNKLAAVKANL